MLKETETELKNKLEAYEKEFNDLGMEKEEIKRIEAQTPHFRRISVWTFWISA